MTDSATGDESKPNGWKAEGNGQVRGPHSHFVPVRFSSAPAVEAAADAFIEPVMAADPATIGKGQTQRVLEATSEREDTLRTELRNANRHVVGRLEADVNDELEKAVDREIKAALTRAGTKKAIFEKKYAELQSVLNPDYAKSYARGTGTVTAGR